MSESATKKVVECFVPGCVDESGPWVPVLGGLICEAHYDGLRRSTDAERLRFVGALAEAREIMDSLLRGKDYAKREAERWLEDYNAGTLSAGFGDTQKASER